MKEKISDEDILGGRDLKKIHNLISIVSGAFKILDSEFGVRDDPITILREISLNFVLRIMRVRICGTVMHLKIEG